VVTLRDYAETGDDSDLANQRKTALGWLGVVGRIIVHLPSVLRYVTARLFQRGGPSIREVRLRNFMEMEPDPDNRVVLGEQRDDDGRPVPVVRHRATALDRRSMAAVQDALALELERNRLGQLVGPLRVDAEPWPIDQDASHHMGTTRMGEEPRTSVVDATCRIHGVPNVYMAGASVFPSSGCANPTFTIVALSIRLAGTLKEVART